MKHRSNIPTAFTLIELLVVVAIVAVLLSILLPSLAAGREQSKSTKCLANLHQMGLCAHMYADENRDRYPISSSIDQHGGWIQTLLPYAQDKLLYRCPSDRSDDWFNPTDAATQQIINDRQNSYAINIYMSPIQHAPPGAPDQTPRYGFVRRDLIKQAARLVHYAEFPDTLGIETTADHIHADHWVPDALTGNPLASPGHEVALGRHSGVRENYCFADGHAATLKFVRTFQYVPERNEVLTDLWNPRFLEPSGVSE